MSPGSSNNTDTNPIKTILKSKRVLLILIVCGINIVLIVVIHIGLPTSKCLPGVGIVEESNQLPILSNLTNCESDGFDSLTITRPKNGLPETSYIKFYFVKENNFTQIVQMCEALNATLWEVHSESEWIAITDKLKSKPGMTMDFWLNGWVEGSECPLGKECRTANAISGDGLPVRWRSSNQLATYSRLYKGQTDQKKCILVENTGDNLWTVGYCDLEKYAGVCVKRNCSYK